MTRDLEDKLSEIPAALRERELLDDDHRRILKTLDEMSPEDTARTYTPRGVGQEVPSIEDVAQEVDVDQETLRNKLHEIYNVWDLSEEQPTGNILSEEEAKVLALVNQHKLRWDPEIDDYRITRIHEYNAELGLGTLYTNNQALEGQRIFRNAMGLNDRLNSVHLQGGVMPPIVAMYGKLKNQGAVMTGQNKTGKRPSEEELQTVRNQLELAQDNRELTPKQVQNLRDFVVNTIDSMEEGARSAAHEAAPLFQDLPEHVPVHLYYSYNDDFNMSEIEDLLISSMRKVHQIAQKAEKQLPKLRSDLSVSKYKLAKHSLNTQVADYILDFAEEQREEFEAQGDELPRGKRFRNLIYDNLFHEDNGDTAPGLDDFRKGLRKRFFRDLGREDEEEFTRMFDEAKSRFFYKNQAIRDPGHIEQRKGVDLKRYEALESTVHEIKDTLSELEQYENALQTEAREGHAWFTHKIAIRPTEAKANLMIQKMKYKDLYEQIFIPELKRVVGKDLNIKLHTDREISVFVEDPTKLLGRNEYDDNKLYGTIMTSVPRTNRQRSNEPLKDSLAELIKKHESSIASRVKNGRERPTTKEEFDKRHGISYSDVLFTSYGADGFKVMPKFAIAPSRIEGEYETNEEIAYYVKLPTRHDMKAVSELLRRGNRGTWVGKRLEKGGPTTGMVYQIEHADRRQEWVFCDDKFFENIADKYSERLGYLEGKLNRARKDEMKEHWEGEIKKVYDEIRPEINYTLLVNDVHLGSANMAGRPTNVDVTRASQQAALHAFGLDGLKAVTGSEILHGNFEIGKRYRTSHEGTFEDPLTVEKKVRLLERGLKKQGYSDKEVWKHVMEYQNEQYNTRSVFRPDDQKEMFRETLHPLFTELMDNGISVYIASGNHWNQSQTEDEARTLRSMFDPKYSDKGLFNVLPHGFGQGYGMEPIRLPGGEHEGVAAMLAHKMASGKTEISASMDQALGNKEDARIYLTADRHQPAAVAEKERFLVLDVGKQTPNPFPTMIGKAPSVRGSMVFGYNPDNELVYSTTFILDDAVDPIIGWDERADRLRRCYTTLQDELSNLS